MSKSVTPLTLATTALALVVFAPSCSSLKMPFGKKKDSAEAGSEAKKEEKSEKKELKDSKKEEPSKDEAKKDANDTAYANLPKAEAAFLAACKEAAKGGKSVVAGTEGQYFSGSELRALAAGSIEPSRQKSIVSALGSYAAQLKAQGIDFAVVPVPPKAVVYPTNVPSEAKLKNGRFDTPLQGLYKELKGVGVNVIDLTDSLRGGLFSKPKGMWPKTDARWGGAAAELAAEKIYRSWKGTPWAKGIERNKAIIGETGTLTFTGDLGASLKAPAEAVPLTAIGIKEGEGIKTIAPSADSPILLVTDANGLAYHQSGVPSAFDGEPKAGLPDQLAKAFGSPVRVKGSTSLNWRGATSQLSPTSAGGVKAVVWCLSASGFLAESEAPTPKPAAAPAPKPSGEPALPTKPVDTGLKLIEPGADLRLQ